MKPEIRKIVTRSAWFFGILAVSAAGMKLASWRNAQNAPDSSFRTGVFLKRGIISQFARAFIGQLSCSKITLPLNFRLAGFLAY